MKESSILCSFLHDGVLEALGVFQGVDGNFKYTFVKK